VNIKGSQNIPGRRDSKRNQLAGVTCIGLIEGLGNAKLGLIAWTCNNKLLIISILIR
jgi:hypothetical protein